jgi:hypothetical protein
MPFKATPDGVIVRVEEKTQDGLEAVIDSDNTSPEDVQSGSEYALIYNLDARTSPLLLKVEFDASYAQDVPDFTRSALRILTSLTDRFGRKADNDSGFGYVPSAFRSYLTNGTETIDVGRTAAYVWIADKAPIPKFDGNGSLQAFIFEHPAKNGVFAYQVIERPSNTVVEMGVDIGVPEILRLK